MKFNFFNKNLFKRKGEILIPEQKTKEELKKAGLLKENLTDGEISKLFEKNMNISNGINKLLKDIKEEDSKYLVSEYKDIEKENKNLEREF